MKPKKKKPNEQDKDLELMVAVKAGTLAVNQSNAEKVKSAWIRAVQWNQLFESAGLAWLPDPEGTADMADVFEEWLIAAYTGNFKSADEARAALHGVRDEIIASVDKE